MKTKQRIQYGRRVRRQVISTLAPLQIHCVRLGIGPMFNKIPIFGLFVLFGLLCVGCDFAAQQQRAEAARRVATAAELKRIGLSMHENYHKESPDGAANDAPRGPDDSKDNQSVLPTAADRSDAVKSGVSALPPTE